MPVAGQGEAGQHALAGSPAVSGLLGTQPWLSLPHGQHTAPLLLLHFSSSWAPPWAAQGGWGGVGWVGWRLAVPIPSFPAFFHGIPSNPEATWLLSPLPGPTRGFVGQQGGG